MGNHEIFCLKYFCLFVKQYSSLKNYLWHLLRILVKTRKVPFVALCADTIFECYTAETTVWRDSNRVSISLHRGPQCPVASFKSPSLAGCGLKVWKFVLLGVVLSFSFLLVSFEIRSAENACKSHEGCCFLRYFRCQAVEGSMGAQSIPLFNLFSFCIQVNTLLNVEFGLVE